MARESKDGGFRRARQRASRACEVCHTRKVRCDVTVHKPCTNCVAFGCECRIPEAKTRRKVKEEFDDRREASSDDEEQEVWIKPALRRPDDEYASIFMGSASNVLSFTGESDPAIYYGLIDTSSLHIKREDISVLKIKGAFNLPPREVCDKLINAYFERCHPMLPCIDKNQFLARYHDPKNQPSLLLLQSIFCCSAHMCHDEDVKNIGGSVFKTIEIFYKRAKALFDSDYERDRLTALQSALLLSTALDSPGRISNNIFYWCRVAITLAQSTGLHRWLPRKSQTTYQLRLYKRIWWCVFIRDRSTSVAYGRPCMINLEDSDVPPLEREDFSEEQVTINGEVSGEPEQQHIDYFIHAIKLHEIMGLILRSQYSVGAERLRLQDQLPDVTQCDIALATWINNIPESLRYSIKEIDRHSYWRALIYLQYYTVLCLAHRPQVAHYWGKSTPYPSWGIAFQAAHMIVRIFQNLRHFDQVKRLPAIAIYSSFSAVIMLVYQTESKHSEVVTVAESALESIMIDIKMLGTMYESCNGIAMVASRFKESIRRPHRIKRHNDLPNSPAKVARVDKGKQFASPPVPVGEPAEPLPAVPPGSAAANAIALNYVPAPQPQSLRDLYMVTQAQDHIDAFEPQLLFPENHHDSSQDDLRPLYDGDLGMVQVLDTPTGQSSGDEVHSGPENMADWYDFLISNQLMGEQEEY